MNELRPTVADSTPPEGEGAGFSVADVKSKDQLVLALAMQASRLGVWELNVADRTVWFSRELEAIFGLKKGEFRGDEDSFFGLVHADDREGLRREVETSVREERPFRVEFRFRRRDGGPVHWMEARGQAMHAPEDGSLRVYGIGADITDRKTSEARSGFLTALDRALQLLSDPDEMMRVAARMLGEHVGADRCAYAEIEDETVFVITGDHGPSVPSIVGRWPVSAFGAECLRQMLANEVYVVEDTEVDDRISPEDLPAYRATQIRAVICVPLHKRGTFTAAMAVHQTVPRTWTPAEIELVTAVVGRCWESLERARAARAVRESDDRFRLALSSGAVTVYEQDVDLRYKWVFPESPYRADVIGKTDEELDPDNHSARRTELKKKVIKTGETVREVVSADVKGVRRWFDLLIEPRFDADGRVVGIGGTALDVTERIRAEHEAKATSERLNLAFSAADLGDWSWDPATDVVTFSERAAEIFGIPPGPVLEWTEMQSMLHREDRVKAARAVEAAVEGHGRYEAEYRVLRPDGRQVWVSALGLPAYSADGEPEGMFGVVQDISARKKLEGELRESEARFRGLMEQAPFSIQLFRPDGQHIRVNKAWEDLWGLTFEDVPEYNILSDPQLEARGIADDIRRAFAGEVVEQPVIRYDPSEAAPAGSRNEQPVRWVSAIIFPLKDAEGQVKEVALIHQDITQRVEAEGFLQRYRLLSQHARDVIWLLRPDGQIVEVNRAAELSYGYTREQLLSMNVADLRGGETLQQLGPQLHAAAAGGVQFETVHKRSDGTEFPVEVNSNSAEFGGERLIMGIVRDISERKQAEEKLRQSENNLRAMADTIPQIAWMAERDGKISWFNRGWYEFTGADPNAAADDSLWARVNDPKVLPDVLRGWARSISTGEPFEMEFPLEGADGQNCWFLARMNPLRDAAAGNVLRWFGTCTDITRIREIEDGLRRARNELEIRVAERTRELAEANELLTAQMRERARAEEERLQLLKRLFTIQEDERGRIARDIHDQLGQRVTALRLKAASAAEAFEPGDAMRERLEELQRTAEQMDHEVSFVSWELRPSILDDLKFADALSNYVSEWSRHSEIPAEFHTDGLAELEIDRDVQVNLYRILQEALNNVAKHAHASRVNVLLEHRRGELSLIVEDDGVGMAAPADDAAARDLQKGFGLVGMRERASLISGHLDIESEPGSGTSIFVRVPLPGRTA